MGDPEPCPVILLLLARPKHLRTNLPLAFPQSHVCNLSCSNCKWWSHAAAKPSQAEERSQLHEAVYMAHSRLRALINLMTLLQFPLSFSTFRFPFPPFPVALLYTSCCYLRLLICTDPSSLKAWQALTSPVIMQLQQQLRFCNLVGFL